MSAAATSTAPPARSIRRIAFAGNPNCGKSTLFNALTGLRQKVANYPGVTVEKRTGRLRGQHGEPMDAIDLPGIYSLHARSPDEAVARDVLLDPDTAPDIVVSVVDATNLERHLFLSTQLIELGIPVVIALNMMDSAAHRRIHLDLTRLRARLGVPIVPMAAARGVGIAALKAAISEPLRRPPPRSAAPPMTTEERYERIHRLCTEALHSPDGPGVSLTERLDDVLTHRVWGWAAFAAIMALVFYCLFALAAVPMQGIESATAAASDWLSHQMPPGMLRDLTTDGVVAGVGGVAIFVPQILILFFFIGLLEDSGYMARAAFIMDRLMTRVGLSGRAFIPLLSAFACAIPAVLAARTVENRRDRLATIMAIPFMSCPARLPVYALMIGLMFPYGGSDIAKAGILLAMYALGIAAAFLTAWLFRSTVLRGDRSMLLLEMPPYRMPSLRTVSMRMIERARIFLTQAGTVILALSIVIWALFTFPKPLDPNVPPSESLAQSAAGRLGRAIEPALRPLGFDWKIGIGLLSSLAAREIFVGTMSIAHNVGNDNDTPTRLRDAMRDDRRPDGSRVYTPLTCVALMVFYVLAMQCLSTLAVVRRETNSLRWPALQLAYMTGVAFAATCIIYQGGRLLVLE